MDTLEALARATAKSLTPKVDRIYVRPDHYRREVNGYAVVRAHWNAYSEVKPDSWRYVRQSITVWKGPHTPDRHVGLAMLHEVGHRLDCDAMGWTPYVREDRDLAARGHKEARAWANGFNLMRRAGLTITDDDRALAAHCLQSYGFETVAAVEVIRAAAIGADLPRVEVIR